MDAQLLQAVEKELMEVEVFAVVAGMVPAVVREEIKNAKARRKRQLERLQHNFYFSHTVKKCWDR